jgi:O-antigen/teichoic acid export membrane protein
MGIIKRQSLKASIVNYAGVFIGVVFFVFIFPHIISKEYLGLINLLQSVTLVLVSLPMLGLTHILLRFYSEWKSDDTAAHFNAFSMTVMGVSLLLFVAAYYLCRGPVIAFYQKESPLFLTYYLMIIPLVIIQAYTQYFEIFALAKMRVAVPAFLREIVLRLLLITLVYLFAYHSLSEKQFIYGFVMVYFIAFIALLIYIVKGLQFSTGKARAYVSNPHFRSHMLYGGGMLMLIVFSNISNFLDGIILPAYLGLGALGIYARPLVLGQMIQVPYRAISLISIPVIREAIVENNMQKVKQLNKDIAINLFLIGCFLFTLLVSNADGIFGLFPAEYIVGKQVLYIIAAGRLLDMAFGLNSEILSYSKYYKYTIIFSLVMMCLTILLNVLLIPRYGMNGAAMAVSVALIVFNVLKTFTIWRKFHFHCFSRHYLSLIAIATLSILILHFIPMLRFMKHHMFLNSMANIAFKGTLGAILFLVPTYLLKVSPDMNDFIKLLITGKIFKGGHKMEHL